MQFDAVFRSKSPFRKPLDCLALSRFALPFKTGCSTHGVIVITQITESRHEVQMPGLQATNWRLEAHTVGILLQQNATLRVSFNETATQTQGSSPRVVV